jgi:(1->4)-alpha-D-glucan 1-alpha-D-glucosylmutase
VQYLDKALREGKIHTSWMNPSEPHEAAVRTFITAILSPESREFSGAMSGFVAKIVDAGFVNSLAQLLLKMTLPGMPDFYRGTEFWDFNLVDPDNRRPVDYDTRRHRLKKTRESADRDLPNFARELAARWPDPDVKLWITSAGLHARREWADVFSNGNYIPIPAAGAAADHVAAFARSYGGKTALSVLPRHFYQLCNSNSCTTDGGPPRPNWGATQLLLPEDFPQDWLDRFSGQQHNAHHEQLADNSNSQRVLDVADLFAVFPVALLTSQAK